MFTRAQLVIGAATVVTGVQAVRLGSALKGVLSDPGAWSAWTFCVLAVGAALLSAVLAIRTVQVEEGIELDPRLVRDAVLSAGVDEYSAEFAIVNQKLQVHAADVARLESRRRLVTGSMHLLVFAWILSLIQFASPMK